MPWPPDLLLPLLLPTPFPLFPVFSTCVCHSQAPPIPLVYLDLTLCDAPTWYGRGGSPVCLICLSPVASNDMGLKNCRSERICPLPSDFGSHHRNGVCDFHDLTFTGLQGKLLCFHNCRSACSRYGFLLWPTVHLFSHD